MPHIKTIDDVWIFGAFEELSDEAHQARRFRNELILIWIVGVNYGIDTLMLVLFWLAGTVPAAAPVGFCLAGIGHMAIFTMAHSIRRQRQVERLHLPQWQMAYALSTELIFLAAFPVIAAYFLSMVFIIFAMGSLRLNFREAMTTGVGVCLIIAAVLLNTRAGKIGISQPSLLETFAIWLSFSLVLLRTVVIGYYGAALREKLIAYNLRLADSFHQARQQATHDALTGLLNRHAILPFINDQISLCHRKDIAGCLAMFDVDHFKRVNDQFGHVTGDLVLKILSTAMDSAIRSCDKLGRIGGEEFLLVMPATHLAEGLAMVERIRQKIEAQPWSAITPGRTITISAGITELRYGDTITGLMHRADHALYQSKQDGRNRVSHS